MKKAPSKTDLYREIDSLVVMSLNLAPDRSKLLATGLLDPALGLLFAGVRSGEWKGGTLSVHDAFETRGLAPRDDGNGRA